MKKQTKHFSIGKYIVWAIGVMLLMAAWILGYRLFPMIPIVYKVIYILLVVLLAGFTFGLAKKGWKAVVISVVSIIVSVVMIYGSDALKQVDNTIDEITSTPEEVKTEMVVVVLKESEAEDISDLSQFLIAYMPEEHEEETQKLMEEINNNIHGEAHYCEFSNITDMIDALYTKTIDALIVDSAFIDVVSAFEGYTDFEERISIVYTYEITNYIHLVEKGESNLESFIVYISGIDKFGHISVRSQSDVNILMVVNTKTKQIQLVNTPRDYFITFPNTNGVKDKLTHAGLYGVDNSMGALEALYDIKIDYFVRMNFSGFEDIIDALGGVDVYSQYDFTVEPIKHYTVGINHLTGIEALAFARERKSFAAGDHVRGRNQMAVIQATINKILSPEILYSYTDVLASMGETFQTNMTSEEIYSLVRMQLADMSAWTVETYAVTGTGSSSTTFTMPNMATYVMIPNDAEVEEAKGIIASVLNAE